MKCRLLICAVLFGVFALGGVNSGPSQQKAETPTKAAEGDDLAKLGKARIEAAEKAYKGWFKYEGGAGLQNGLTHHLSVQWLHAELDLATKKEERTTAYASHLKRMKDWEDEGKVRYANRPDHPYLAVIVSSRKEAEYWVAKVRSGK